MLRRVDGRLFKETRTFHTFHYNGGQLVGTKSVTREGARQHIEKTLGTKLKKVA